jgi:DNA-binding SARP family transcriptional activator/tetratricopeptide (TPR) repeat protein
MRFALLGALVVVSDSGQPTTLAAPRLRILLTALLLRANMPVSGHVLAEAVWDGNLPPGAGETLRSYVRRLRRALGAEGGARIEACHPGYLIRLGGTELDVLEFETLCREAAAALHSAAWSQASDAATRALDLWRGPPLLDVPSRLLHDEIVPRLEQLRLQAVEGWAEAGLHLGRHEQLVPQLRDLTIQHPLRERFHAQLMLALYRCSRQAEALESYRDARRTLVRELGVEPGPELRSLHERVLAGDTSLFVPPRGDIALESGRATPVIPGQPPVAPPPTAEATVPRELPPRVAHFTGRTGEVAVLNRLLDPPDDQMPGTVVISAIGGTAGVGKTALAVHWAHQAAGRFPDGQLYVSLRGYDPGRPVTPAHALAGFLRSLGVAGQDIPAEEAERAALYRSLLAGRRILVVLDNAGSAEQVRPLLPGDPACAVVVTSRDALTGLVARDGAWRLDLDLLPLEDAIGLLRMLIGARVDADPAAAAVLASQCCRLPLALRVAAELTATRTAIPLAELVAELADQRRRLDLLDADGDPRTGIRAVFSWSFQHLDADTARTFQLLSLHPGSDLDSYAAAALTGMPVEQASRRLDQLARASLIQPAGTRYAVHDLLRAYATEQAASQDRAAERRMALTRLFDYYLYAAAVAMDTLYPAEHQRWKQVPSAAASIPPVTGPAAARAWLDAERASLVAITGHAATHGWPGHATQLAGIVFRYLSVGGYYSEAVTIYGHASQAASQTGDRAAEAEALTNLGVIDHEQGRDQRAAGYFDQALVLFRQTGDVAGQARALGNLGGVELMQGRYQQAASRFEQALALRRATGDRTGQARALGNLGRVELKQGRYTQAADWLRQALVLFREIGDRIGEAYILNYLGDVNLRQGRHRSAAGHFEQALVLNREIGNRPGEAYVLANLGLVDLRQGRYVQAVARLRHSLALLREIGDRSGEAEALNGLGEVFLAAGRPGQARRKHATALELTGQIGDKYEQARAHHGLACAYHADGEPDQARRHWQEALALYTALGAPEADQVRAQLATAGTATTTGGSL